MQLFSSKAILLAITMFALLSLLAGASAQTANGPLPPWAFGGFVRPPQVNPIIAPDKTAVFEDPMSKKPVSWESDNTFNPAATVKDGKIEVLYRAEDNSGQGIGAHTSRIGIAESKTA